MSKFRRSRENKVMFGIFSGLEKFLQAKGYKVDRYSLRIIYVLLIIFTPITISWCLFIAYFVAALVFPTKEDEEEEKNKEEELNLTKKDDENDPS